MDIKKLPPSILVALGLAGCGPTVSSDDDGAGEGSASASETQEPTTSACLDVDPTNCLSSTGFTTGPCLGAPQTTTGPCLSTTGFPPETTSSSGSGSGSEDSGSESGTDSGSTSAGATTVGPCLAPPPNEGEPIPGEAELHSRAAPARSDVVDGILARGVLPPDVAKKLKG